MSSEPYRLQIFRRLTAGGLGIVARRRAWNRRIRRLVREYPLRPQARLRRVWVDETGRPRGRPLRVLILTRWYLRRVGGLATYMRTLRAGLRRRGHRVRIVSQGTFRDWHRVHRRIYGPTVARLRPVYGRRARLIASREADIRTYARCLQRINLRRYDVLHAQDLFTANVLIALRPRHRRPVIYTPHGIMSLRRKIPVATNPVPFSRMYHRVLDHIAASASDRVVVLSRRFPRVMRAMGARRARLMLSPSGIRDPQLPPPADRQDPQRPITITYLGRMKPNKGPQFLLRAMARVQRRRPRVRVRVWMIGNGPYLRALRRMARRMRLRRVRFWGYRRRIWRFLARSDILVVPGLDETFPMALIEGLFAGQAVVGSRRGGIPEMIRHGKTGLLFPPGNSRVLARQLWRLIHDHELRLNLATAAQEDARRRFSVDRMVSDIERAYRSVVR